MSSEVVLIAFGRMLIGVLLVISIRVMTHYLPPAQYGIYALLTTFQVFASLILIGPVSQYLNRHTHEWLDKGQLRNYLRTLTRYWFVVALCIGFAASIWLHFYFYQDNPMLSIAGGIGIGILIFGSTSLAISASRLNMIGYRKPSVTWNVTGTVLSLFFSWLLVAWIPDAVTWLIGQAVGYLCAAFGAWRALDGTIHDERENRKAKFLDVLPWRSLRRFCLPLAVISLFTWLDTNAYRFVLQDAWGLHRFGLFVIGLTLPSQMTVVMEAIVQQFIYPFVFRGLSDAASQHEQRLVVSDLISFLTPIYLGWGAFLLLSSDAFLYLLTNPRYHSASVFLVFGIAIELFRLLIAPWLFVAQAKKEFSNVVSPFAIGAMLVLSGAFIIWYAKWGEPIFGICLVVAGLVKCYLVIRKMQREFLAELALRPILITSLFVMIALVLHLEVPWLHAGGWQEAILIIVISTLCAAGFLMAYLRNCPSITRLKQIRLASDS